MNNLLKKIEKYLRLTGRGEHWFGFHAAKNGRLIERLRAGGEVLPRVEARIRAFMAENPPESFKGRGRRRAGDHIAGAGKKVEGDK